MTQDRMHFKDFLWDSFCDGQLTRELRLSQDELSCLHLHYPTAVCDATDLSPSDGKRWYCISLAPCIAQTI